MVIDLVGVCVHARMVISGRRLKGKTMRIALFYEVRDAGWSVIFLYF
jgi:hypothetical protein